MNFRISQAQKGAHLAFFSSLFFSRLADQVLLFLVPLVVFQTTQSAAWTGIAFFVETLPRFLAFPVCGALCDRLSPLKLLHLSQVYRALVCGVGVAASGWLGGVGWLMALSAVCGVLTTQGLMAREVMLPVIFKAERFEAVLAKTQIADQLGMVLGPLLAALALQWWPWQGVVLATAALFLLADRALALWRRAQPRVWPTPQIANGPWLQPYRIAFGHVLHLPGLLPLVVLAAGVNLVIGVTLATSAAMVTGVHELNAASYAWLQTAGAVVTVLILLVIARVALSAKTLGGLAYVLIAFGGLLTAWADSAGRYALGFLLVIGFDKMFSVYLRSRRQQLIPPADLGKTTGVIVMLNNLSQPLAGLLVGLYAADANPSAVIATLSLGMAMLGVAVGLSQRWRRRRGLA